LFSFCGHFGVGVVPSHVLGLFWVGFLVWAVFWVVLWVGERFFVPMHYVGVCWLGWDEDGELCWALCIGVVCGELQLEVKAARIVWAELQHNIVVTLDFTNGRLAFS
jgi:hypothetical protein